MENSENRRVEDIEKLKAWLISLGCSISNKVKYPHTFGGDLLGMVATGEIHPEEILMTIKPEAIFSTELLGSCVLEPLFSAHPELFNIENSEGLDNQFLTLVVYEKLNPSSKWSLFFNTLPQLPENLCDWELNELMELQDPDLIIDCKIRKEKNQNSYKELETALRLHPELFPAEVSVKDIEWCWKIIWTRSFMRSADHSALIPFADFVNHGRSTTGFYFVDQKEEETDEGYSLIDSDEIYTEEKVCVLCCRDLYEINFLQYDLGPELMEDARIIALEAQAIDESIQKQKPKGFKKIDDVKNSDFVIVTGERERYKPGEQIMFEYGNYSNTSLLTHYGFTIPNNRSEFYRLKIPLRKLVSATQLRNLPQKFKPDAVVVFCLNMQSVCLELLRTLRALMWNPGFKKTAFFSQSDLDLEKKVISRYQGIVRKCLKGFPTRIDEDVSISPKSIRHHFAITFRILKKQIVHLHIDLANTALDIVDKLSNGIAVDLSRSHLEKELEQYIKCIEFYKSKDLQPPKS